MPSFKPRGAIALAFLATPAVAAAAPFAPAPPVGSQAPPAVRMEVVEFAGRSYLYPASEPAHVKRFGEESFEVGFPTLMWNAILARVAPLRDWQRPRWPGSVLIYVTRPNESFQWVKRKGPGMPPVREPVVREAVRGRMELWASRGVWGQEDVVYVTYADRPDIYVKCDRIALDDWAAGCDLFWLDGGALHVIGIVGDWLKHAPAQASEYERAVTVRRGGS